MPLFYDTGEQVQQGDHILLNGNAGQIEEVIDSQCPATFRDPASARYASELGDGVMIVEPKVFGRVYITTPFKVEDEVSFVARASHPGNATREPPV